MVATAKAAHVADPLYRVAFINDHYSKVWSKVHAHVGVSPIDDYITLDHLQKGFDFVWSL